MRGSLVAPALVLLLGACSGGYPEHPIDVVAAWAEARAAGADPSIYETHADQTRALHRGRTNRHSSAPPVGATGFKSRGQSFVGGGEERLRDADCYHAIQVEREPLAATTGPRWEGGVARSGPCYLMVSYEMLPAESEGESAEPLNLRAWVVFDGTHFLVVPPKP
ncbi:MAG: hypothetical protein VYE77_10900 [Planctomycetota bacterium]|nr:hypothetical protein [Planctomycetota bacterium]